MVSIGGRVHPSIFSGLDQFPIRGSFGDLGYCVGGLSAYNLEFSNDDDVICLLLGDIVTRTRFEDNPERQLVFRGETTAFHPRRGRVRVQASQANGFIAFAYPQAFQEAICDRTLGRHAMIGSMNNLAMTSIRHLARYARDLITQRGGLQPLEIQYLGGMVYLETLNALDAREPGKPDSLPDAIFRRLCDAVDNHLDSEIDCAALAAVADLPLRRVFAGIKERTGLTPHQWVIERRMARAMDLLRRTTLPISEIALSCGFASQQHLTSTMSKKHGVTPAQLRNREQPRALAIDLD